MATSGLCVTLVTHRVISGKPDHPGKAGQLSKNRTSDVLFCTTASIESYFYLFTIPSFFALYFDVLV